MCVALYFMSNKLISSIVDPVYGHSSYIEYPLRDHNKLIVTLAKMVPELPTPDPDHM